MKNTKILTDIELRAHWYRTQEKSYTVEAGTQLTPAADDFIREHHIQLHFAAPAMQKMSVTPIPTENGKAKYIDFETGAALTEKPENMTHIRGNLLVSKQHPRIAFRGKLDSLMAHVMGVQLLAEEKNAKKLTEELEEVLLFLREMLAAEVKDQPMKSLLLLQMNSEEIRHCSHHVKECIGIDHPIPSYRMGRLCVALNELRTQVRETELCAIHAFAQDMQHQDIIEGLNRLSSCIYILFCRAAKGVYGEEK